MDAKAKKVPFQVTDIVCAPKDTPRRTPPGLARSQAASRDIWTSEYAPPDKLPDGGFPLYTKVDFDALGNYVLPPRGVKLSDENLYLVTKSSTFTARCSDDCLVPPAAIASR
jgi:hypothetical protein